MSIVFILAIIGSIISAFFFWRNQNQRQKRMERMSKTEDIQYDFYQVNTQELGGTTVNTTAQQLILETDIHAIQVAYEKARVSVYSTFQDIEIGFDCIIIPFDTFLLELEGYKNINHDGKIVFFGTKALIHIFMTYCEALREEALTVDFDAEVSNIYFDIISYTRDTAEDALMIQGRFPDQNTFDVHLYLSDFRIKIVAPISSLNNMDNFRYLELET